MANTLNTTELPGVISLFSGAGGLDLGFHQAGFSIRLAVERWEAARETLQTNFPHTGVLDLDVGEPSFPSALLEHIRGEGLQSIGLIGGPPCQAFSQSNVTAGAKDDPRRALLLAFARLPDFLIRNGIGVRFVLLENVVGLTRKANQPILSDALAMLAASGLTIAHTLLDSSDYGVPQTRRRFLAVGIAGQKVFKWPKPEERKPRTVQDAIAHLPSPTFNQPGINPAEVSYHPNHWTSRPRSSRFAENRFNRWRSFRQIAWDAPSPTVAYGNREIHVHPDGGRRLSILEGMLLQGFSEDYTISGNFSQQVTQVSNAVPPPLAKAVALSIRAAIAECHEE